MNVKNLLSVTFASMAVTLGAHHAQAEETWTPIGEGTLRDDLITSYYNLSHYYEFKVEMEESQQTPGRYRLVNAYKNCPSVGGDPWPEDVTNYVIVDASDPEHVYIEHGDLSYNIGQDQSLCIWTIAHDYYHYLYHDWTIADNEGVCGTLQEGAITFPPNTILVTCADGYTYTHDPLTSWLRSNTHGMFRLKLPTTPDTDIRMGLTGITDDGTEVRYTIDPDTDIEYIKLALFEGQYTDDMRAKVENDEVATRRVESLCTVSFPFEKDGVYTLVAVPYVDGHSYKPSTLTAEWSYSQAEWRNVGKCQYTEAILSSNYMRDFGFEVDEYEYEVECQQNVENPAKIRLVDPYSPDCYPRATSTTYDSSRHYYLVFDLTRHNCVILEHAENIGLNLGVGNMAIRSTCDLYTQDHPYDDNWSIDKYLASGLPTGHYNAETRTVTFDPDGIRIRFYMNPQVAWYEANQNNHFKLVLPEDIEIPESGISGIDTDNDAPAEYYTLDGMRIDAAQANNGMYIIRQGGKSRKVLINP